MTLPEEVIIYTDGASRGNPGPSAIGVQIEDKKGNIYIKAKQLIGFETNVFAAYCAAIKELYLASKYDARRIILKSDSLEVFIKCKILNQMKTPTSMIT